MRRIEKSIASFARPHPLVFKARHAARIKLSHTHKFPQPPDDAVVHHHQHHEKRNRDQQQPEKPAAAQQPKGRNYSRKEVRNFGVPQPDMPLALALHASLVLHQQTPINRLSRLHPSRIARRNVRCSELNDLQARDHTEMTRIDCEDRETQR